MKINVKIKATLDAFGIDQADGIAYLLSIWFDCRPSYTPLILVQKMNTTGILGIENAQVIWNIPLFEEVGTSQKWEWVKEWNDAFGQINKKRKAGISAVMLRMQSFFSSNPDVRKDEVIGATKMYFKSLNSADYLTSSHYFIFKGTGKDRVSMLENWVEAYREYCATTQLQENNHVSNIIQ